jgi:hypothetical protein
MTTSTVTTAAQEPAHTGDCTNTAGSLATTVGGIKGVTVPSLASGYLYYNGTSFVWQSPSGSGTVNSGTANQLAYYSASGTSVTGATVGAGLSLSGGTITTVGQQPMPFAVFVAGTFAASQTMFYYKASVAFTIPAGATNSYFTLMTAATGACTFTLYKNGTSFGIGCNAVQQPASGV